MTLGKEVKPSTSNENDSVANIAQSLNEFLLQLEDYTPTIPHSITSHYLHEAGFDSTDSRIVHLISIAAQKFISDIANDALQHCKTRTSNAPGSHSSSKNKANLNTKDRRYVLTLDDLTPTLQEYGITIKKPQYFV